MPISDFIVKITKNGQFIGNGVLVNLGDNPNSYVFTVKHNLFDDDDEDCLEQDSIKIIWERNIEYNIQIRELLYSEDDNNDVGIIVINKINTLTKGISNEPPKEGRFRLNGYSGKDDGDYKRILRGEIDEIGDPYLIISWDATPYTNGLDEYLPGLSGSPIRQNGKVIGIYKGEQVPDGMNHRCVSIKYFFDLLIKKGHTFSPESFTHCDLCFNDKVMINECIERYKKRLESRGINPTDINNKLKNKMFLPESCSFSCLSNHKVWNCWLFILFLQFAVNEQDLEINLLPLLEIDPQNKNYKVGMFFTNRSSLISVVDYIVKKGINKFQNLNIYIISGDNIAGDLIQASRISLMVTNISTPYYRSRDITNIVANNQFGIININSIKQKGYVYIENVDGNILDYFKEIFLEILQNARI